jgi:hypothetical protein
VGKLTGNNRKTRPVILLFRGTGDFRQHTESKGLFALSAAAHEFGEKNFLYFPVKTGKRHAACAGEGLAKRSNM